MTTTARLGSSKPDVVVRLLEDYGDPVDCATNRLSLEGDRTLWMVTDGGLDLFAVDGAGTGRWRFLGRLEPGAIISAPIQGPHHTLMGRPLPGCAMRRLPVDRLLAAQRNEWPARRGFDGSLAMEERALAWGIDMGLQLLIGITRDKLPPRDFVLLEPGGTMELEAGQDARVADGVLWAEVLEGYVRIGDHGAFTVREAGEIITLGASDWLSCDAPALLRLRDSEKLLADGTLWGHIVAHQARFLYAMDRWFEQLERGHDTRIAEGRQAGDAASTKAELKLLASIQPRRRAAGTLPGDDQTFAACRLVADVLGVTLVPPNGQTNNRLDLVEQIAVRSRLRARRITLRGVWWHDDNGPLVGHLKDEQVPVALLWSRGGYDAVDPETGRRTRVTRANADELESAGVMFYPPLPTRPMSSWRLLLFGLRGTRTDIVHLLLGALAAVGLGLIVPIATGSVLGEYVPNADRDLIVLMSMTVVVASVVAAAFALLANVAMLRIEGRFDGTLQAAVWDRLLRLPARFFGRHSTGELASAAMGVSGIRQILGGVTSVAVHSFVLGWVNFALLLYLSVPLAMMAAGLVVLSAAVSLVLSVRRMKWQRDAIALDHKLSNLVFHTLRGLAKLRVAAAENFAFARWADDFVREKELTRRIGRVQNAITVFNAGYVPLCTFVFFLLLVGPAKDLLTVSQFLSFNVALTITLTSMIQFTNSITSVAAVVPMFAQLQPVLDEVPEVSEGSTVPGELTGEIEVNHLSFEYSADGPRVLDDISFRISPGEFVAIVGPSGCGKSTLLRLLIGFEQPTTGTVLYDRQDLSSLDPCAVRRQCGVVLQNAQPLSGTVLESISGAENYTVDEAWAAAELAGLGEDISRMPMGMHTIITDSGSISGGQRQRLMIAHALIRRPRILFFDEATSALDNVTQRIVTDSTRKLRATRVVIAHRLSTVMDADKVIVLADGRISQCGPPTELLADTGGLFHQLVRRQMQ